MGKHRIAVLGLAAFGLVCFSTGDDALAAPPGASVRMRAAPAAEVSSQRRRLRRSRVRIDVYPRAIGPRLIGPPGFGIDLYPRPYPYDWPGPNAQRECVAWLAPEARPSGPVIVPHRRCRWVPG